MVASDNIKVNISKARPDESLEIVEYFSEVVIIFPSKNERSTKVAKETDFLSFEEGNYHRNAEEERQLIMSNKVTGLGVHLIARDPSDNSIVAVTTGISPGRRCRHVYVLLLTVKKSHWRMGIGKKMTLRTIEECKKLGAEKITLRVRTDNLAAIALYMKMGFTIDGSSIKEAKVNGQYKDLYSMSLFLS